MSIIQYLKSLVVNIDYKQLNSLVLKLYHLIKIKRKKLHLLKIYKGRIYIRWNLQILLPH